MSDNGAIAISEASYWKRPVLALMMMAVANQLAFATWNALHVNFAIDVVGFAGQEMGTLHTLREIPGFLSFAAVLFLLIMREQTLGLAVAPHDRHSASQPPDSSRPHSAFMPPL